MLSIGLCVQVTAVRDLKEFFVNSCAVITGDSCARPVGFLCDSVLCSGDSCVRPDGILCGSI